MTSHGVTLKVCVERCHGCPFGPHRCVSAERARELLDECDRTDTHFVCHEFVIASDEPVTCAGYYMTGRRPRVFRFAAVFGIPIERVTPPGIRAAHERSTR